MVPWGALPSVRASSLLLRCGAFALWRLSGPQQEQLRAALQQSGVHCSAAEGISILSLCSGACWHGCSTWVWGGDWDVVRGWVSWGAGVGSGMGSGVIGWVVLEGTLTIT